MKKVISLLLSLIMIVTGCSVGFTAFAQEDGYWNGASVEETKEELELLLNLLIQGPMKELLEENNIVSVNENTTAKDVIAGVSPTLARKILGIGNLDLSFIDGPSIQFDMTLEEFEARGYSAEQCVPLVNGMLNKLLPILDMSLVKNIFSTGIRTPMNLSGALQNVWNRLYNAPVDTIAELLPVLTVALDEFIIPTFVSDGERSNELISIVTDLLFNDKLQRVGSDIGIGDLRFDLNKTVPAVLHWITGDTEGALDILDHQLYGPVAVIDKYGNPLLDASGNQVYKNYDSSVPRFTDVYAIDSKIASVTADRLAGAIGQKLSGNSDAVMGLIVALRASVDSFLASDEAKIAKVGLVSEGSGYSCVALQTGMNNLSVAIPCVMDLFGKALIGSAGKTSDWSLIYSGKFAEKTARFSVDGNEYSANEIVNTDLQRIKSFANAPVGKANQIIGTVLDVISGSWVNAAIDLALDYSGAEDTALPAVEELLNQLFCLSAEDAAAFSLEERANGYVGLSDTSVSFILNNIYFYRNGAPRGIVPVALLVMNALPSDLESFARHGFDHILAAVITGVTNYTQTLDEAAIAEGLKSVHDYQLNEASNRYVCAYCGDSYEAENPTPVDPTPVDPTPVDPTPVDPAPVTPAPTEAGTAQTATPETAPAAEPTASEAALTEAQAAALKAAKPKLKKAKKAKKSAVKVTWKKVADATEYEIQYGKKKSFKKAKTVKVGAANASATLKKLKKGKYYVRVRAVNGTVKSAWSKSKTIKVK